MSADKGVHAKARVIPDNGIVTNRASSREIHVSSHFCKRTDEGTATDRRRLSYFSIGADVCRRFSKDCAFITGALHLLKGFFSGLGFSDGNHKADLLRPVLSAEFLEAKHRAAHQLFQQGMIIDKDDT